MNLNPNLNLGDKLKVPLGLCSRNPEAVAEVVGLLTKRILRERCCLQDVVGAGVGVVGLVDVVGVVGVVSVSWNPCL